MTSGDTPTPTAGVGNRRAHVLDVPGIDLDRLLVIGGALEVDHDLEVQPHDEVAVFTAPTRFVVAFVASVDRAGTPHGDVVHVHPGGRGPFGPATTAEDLGDD